MRQEKIILMGGIEFSYIENFDGYFVSKCGKIYSDKTGRILKPWINNNGYERIELGGTRIFIHQAVAVAYLGWKPGDRSRHLDHIDANKTNNHVSNLRIISVRDNVYKEKNKLTGAQLTSGGKWMAQIRVNGWLQYLGSYDTQEQAHSRYKVARMLLARSSKDVFS